VAMKHRDKEWTEIDKMWQDDLDSVWEQCRRRFEWRYEGEIPHKHLASFHDLMRMLFLLTRL